MRWTLISINISHNSSSSPHTISHFPGSHPALRGIFPILTVLGFGVDGAVLRADFSHQHRAEEVGAALELGTDSPAEICHLVRCPNDLHGRPVRLPSVPREENRTPHHPDRKILWCYRPDSPLPGKDPPQGLLGECLSWECRWNGSALFSGSISAGLKERKGEVNWRCGHNLGRNLWAHWIHLQIWQEKEKKSQ